jgi:hypothetical protein
MALKKSYVRAGAATIAALILLLFVGHRYGERLHADRSAVSAIGPGMARSNVVQRLGVMYDDSARGEYADSDKVLAGMQGRDSITHLCCWRIRNSRDVFWVGLDDKDNVISVILQKR